MVSSSSAKTNVNVPLSFSILTINKVNERDYIPEPPLEREKAKIWASQILIPFSVTNNTLTLMGPFSRKTSHPDKVKDLFLCYFPTKTLVFENQGYELRFMIVPHHIFCASPTTHNATYLA